MNNEHPGSPSLASSASPDKEHQVTAKAKISWQIIPDLLLQVLLIASISLVVNLLADGYLHKNNIHPVVTVDVDHIMQNKMNEIQLSNGQFKKETVVKKSKQWAHDLADEISQLSRQTNAVVLVRPAVIEGAYDMTQQVVNNMEHKHDQNHQSIYSLSR